jgi:hypothetical protein
MYKANRKHNTYYRSWDTPLFKVWHAMIRRCHSSKAPNRKYYFDRGIAVCQLWRDDFSAFEKWSLDNGYRQGLQIDRIDVNGNYEPSNCRWISPRMNSHNRSNNIEIMFRGEKRKLVDVIDETKCDIDTRTVYKRIIQHGWDVEKALKEPKHYQGKRGRIILDYNGQKMSTRDIAKKTGLSPSAIRNRLFKQNMTIEQAIKEPRKTHKHKEVSEVSDTERGTGGFGSTGV